MMQQDTRAGTHTRKTTRHVSRISVLRTSDVNFPDRNIKTSGFLWVTSCGDGQI